MWPFFLLSALIDQDIIKSVQSETQGKKDWIVERWQLIGGVVYLWGKHGFLRLGRNGRKGEHSSSPDIIPDFERMTGDWVA